MKIIIFGSTGLVGSALVRIFKNTQYEIFVPKRKEVDLFSNPETKNIFPIFHLILLLMLQQKLVVLLQMIDIELISLFKI